ncbi:MAG: ABC transporter permease, partial [Gammaproteobacteria bacterium]|nr:ABC transporter permease [Gammaproteobacteria bacterium]
MTWQQQLTAYKTIVIKEYLRFIRIWIQTVLPPAITTALYFVIFGELIGSQLQDIDGYRYMDYIVPGLILLAVISNAYANVVSSFYSSKFQRSVEELLVSPVPNAWILVGFVSGGMLRGVVVGAIVTLVAMCFTDIPFAHPFISLMVLVLTAMLFSLAGFINAV